MRSFIMRSGAVLGTALLALGFLSAPAHAESATLSGTITSDATGDPVSGCITIYDTDYNYVTTPCTDESGTWTADVEAGVGYKLEVQPYDGRHVGEWAQDAASFDEAEVVVAPATINVGLQVGGVIGGSLRRVDGSAAEAASVTVVRAADQSYVTSTNVGPSGDDQWAAVVAPGEYLVEYWDWPAHQWAVGQSSPETATRFTVAADATTRVDDQFLPAAKVRGTVVSDATGEPVDGACVTVIRPVDDPDWIEQVGEGCAGPDGTYEIEVPEEGTFAAQFTDPSGSFISEFTGDTKVVGDAATFEVTRATPAVVNASLASASAMTGRAVDAKTGSPIEGACPQAYFGRDGGYVRGAVPVCSGPDGRWSLKGLAAGEYALAVDAYSEPRVYATTWAFKATSQATATLISVPAASTKAIRDVQMMPGGSVSGVITGPTGEPVSGAWVRLDHGYPGRVGPGEGPHTAQTDEDGRYTIQGVPPGEHTAFVYGWSWEKLAPEWSGNVTTHPEAQSFRVKALKATRFDAQLAPGATLDITVVDADGQPVDGYLVGAVYDAAGDGIGDFDISQGVAYGPGPLPAGSFTLSLENHDTGETYWYEGVTRESGQTAVALGEGEHKAITFQLP